MVAMVYSSYQAREESGDIVQCIGTIDAEGEGGHWEKMSTRRIATPREQATGA